jgi:hypothetical protein
MMQVLSSNFVLALASLAEHAGVFESTQRAATLRVLHELVPERDERARSKASASARFELPRTSMFVTGRTSRVRRQISNQALNGSL